MTTHLKIIWPDHHVVIELCKTPIVERWKQCIQDVIDKQIPTLVKVAGTPFYHGYERYPRVELQSQAVEEINKAIQDVNRIVGDGRKFPYHAYEDMPWEHTNLMHRCFTTAEYSQCCWQLGLTKTLKAQAKTVGDEHMPEWIMSIAPKHFDVSNCFPEFSSANSRINKWIHVYEDNRMSQRAMDFKRNMIQEYGKDIESVSLELDVFESDGRKWYEFERYADIETIRSSFPDNTDECNVRLMKSITGKDYFQCFQEYDDPCEWDIQNMGKIKGGLTYYPNNELNNILNNVHFQSWYKGYGLTADQVAPPPIGKIVEDTVDYNTFVGHPTNVYTDGSQAIVDQYRQMRYELV